MLDEIMLNFLCDIAMWWLDPWNFFSGAMSAVALCGTLMNAERNKYGFVFWLISNLYMTIRFAVIGEYAQMILFFVYFVFAIRGIIAWSKKEKE